MSNVKIKHKKVGRAGKIAVKKSGKPAKPTIKIVSNKEESCGCGHCSIDINDLLVVEDNDHESHDEHAH